MKLDSIIFDLDGTLWDSTESVIESWNETISKYDEVKNKITLEDMKSIMGLVIKDVAIKFFPYLDENKALEIALACCKSECLHLEKHGARLYENLEDVLEVLSKRYDLYIVSNCQDGYIEAFYKSHGLEKYFKDYESAGRTGLSKGENIKLIMKRNNLVKTAYVGDTRGDETASIIAGVPFIYASYGFGEIKDSKMVLDKVEDILQLI